MPEVTLTAMCMIRDATNNRVLVQERVKSWKGISFPGGHVNPGESVVEAAIREVKEETGLDVSDLQPCGFVHWLIDQTDERYFVFQFRTDSWSGELVPESEEGKVFWVGIEELAQLNLSRGFAERLPMFLEGKHIEGFGVWNSPTRERLKFA